MDDFSQRRRHNEQPTQQITDNRHSYTDPSQQSRSLLGAAERYRPTLLSTSPATPRRLGDASGYSAYYQEPPTVFPGSSMSATGLSYSSEFGQDARQQVQNYGGYSAPNVMYNVPQPDNPASVYDVQQYGQRQPATLQLVSSDVASSYFTAEPSAGPVSNLQQSAPPSSEFQQSPTLHYQVNVPSISGMPSGLGNVDASPSRNYGYNEEEMEVRWVHYQRQLSTIFQDVANGALRPAAETLLDISEWLLTQVVDLG